MHSRLCVVTISAFACLWAVDASAGTCQVGGGTLRVGGGARIVADSVTVAPGSRLAGAGTLDAALSAGGTVAPDRSVVGEVAVLAVTGAATFLPGARFECDVTAHEALDRLNVGGPVSGTCSVVVSCAAGAYPVEATIVDGGAGSAYAAFAPAGADPTNWWLSAVRSDLLLTHRFGDSDADGVPDWWELRHFGSRVACITGQHSDDDAMCDGDEYVAGTDPHDAGSALRLTAIAADGDQTRVVWSSVSGRRYAVKWSPDDMSAGTTVATNLPATPPENGFDDATGGETQGFYRIAVSYP